MEGPQGKNPKQQLLDTISKKIEQITDGLGMEIDPGIRETIIYLQAHGFKTYASCEGHEDWGLPYPWVDIGEMLDEDTRYQELERKINFETGENTLNAAEKKELRQKELDAEKENRKETGRLKELLAKFYKQRKSDVRLGMEAKGLSSVRILPQRAPRGKPDDIRKKIPPEKISRDLKLFQAEMTQFTEFLKQEFFTSSPAH